MFVPRHQINKIVSNKGRKPKLKFCSVKSEEQRKKTQVEVLFCKNRGTKEGNPS